jgi:conflict system STAND superfamily ATPase/TIR domain-containing protein
MLVYIMRAVMANDYIHRPPQTNDTRDLFLSYNSRDLTAVISVRRLLDERKISAFFDRNQLSAGSRWVSLLENEVGGSRAAVIFIGPHGLGDWQEMEMQLALVRQIDEKKAGRSFPVIPLILPGATPEKELGFLKLYTWVDLRGRLDDPAAIDELERAVRGEASTQLAEAAVEMCPYRALQAFREQDEKLFFGRDRFAEQLLEKARDEKLKLIAVVGPSGSGKSSVVQAGLIPRLRRERAPLPSWETAIFTPGKTPFHNLAAALVTTGAAERDRGERLDKAEKLGRDLASGDIRIEAAINTALAEASGATRLLLVVDQAEELFTLIKEQEELYPQTADQDKIKLPPADQDGKLFINRLLAAAETAPGAIAFTLRTDFYSQAISFSRELGELIINGQVNILPMSRDELRQAIVAPADSVKLKFEDGLVDRILDHVQDQPGNLPLLEFALTELWNRRQGNLLSHVAYKEIGGVEGAISRRAEELFNRLSRERQETAQRVLTRLVRVADATEEGTDTRQRVRLSELDAGSREVARTFADVRLLVTNRIEIKNEKTGAVESEEIVEVAHEALIHSWQRLKDLLNRDRQFLLWRQRLGIALSEWRRTGGDSGALLRGVPLKEARRWRKERGQDLNDRELEYIGHSESGEKKPKYWIAAAAALVTVVALAALGWKLWDNRPDSQIKKILANAPELVQKAVAGTAPDSFGMIKSKPDTSKPVHPWLNALVLTGGSDQALDAARKIEDVGPRSEALISIVEALVKAGKTEEAKQTATEAFNVYLKIENIYSRQRVSESAITALAKAGKTEEALDAARKYDTQFLQRLLERQQDVRQFGGGYMLPQTLEIAAEALAKAGKAEDALNAVSKIEDANRRPFVMVKVVEALATAGKTEEALNAARKFENRSFRRQAVTSVVEALIESGKEKQALDAALNLDDGYSGSLATKVIQALTKAGKAEEALGAARKIGNNYFRAEALDIAAESLAKAGKTEDMKLAATEALGAARKIGNNTFRAKALAGIVEVLVKAGKTEEAKQAATEAFDAARNANPEDEYFLYRYILLVDVVEAFAKVGMTEEMKLAATEAFNATRTLRYADSRSKGLASVAEAFAKAGMTEEMKLAATEALEAARQTGDTANRAKALADVVDILGKVGKTEEVKLAAGEAVAAFRKVKAYRLSETLAGVVEAFAKVGKTEEVKLAITYALTLPGLNENLKILGWSEYDDSRSEKLIEIVEASAKAGMTGEFIEVASRIDDPGLRSQALVRIVDALAKDPQTAGRARNVIELAQQAAEQITKEEEKSRALANVATGLAKLHLYRQARELVDLNNTSAADKLATYTAILREYYIENHPDQAKLFEKKKPGGL